MFGDVACDDLVSLFEVTGSQAELPWLALTFRSIDLPRERRSFVWTWTKLFILVQSPSEDNESPIPGYSP